MPQAPSLAGRAVLALALMVGFYVLAVALALGLLYLPYLEWTVAHRLHIKITLFCVIGAGVILWSIIPRPDRFVAPGPALFSDQHPRLFDTLKGIAGAVGQEMPAEVYLVPDVNAWVSQRGGVMGIGARRVMGLGLPLLQVLTVSQLRAVLAHEFGHYHGGDTALGPWVYKTRAAIGRTVQGLAGHSGLLQAPFLWYGNLFLRVSHAVSRRQEYAADALAARAVGGRHLAAGLRAVHGAGVALKPFWDSEVVPVLNAGFRPPIADGFGRFLEAAPVKEAIAALAEEEAGTTGGNPFDTHPPLGDRLTALAALPPGEDRPGEAHAITLLEDVPDLERALLSMSVGDGAVADLEPVAWDDIAVKISIPSWEGLVHQDEAALAGMTAATIPETMKEPRAFGRHMAKTAKRALTPAESAQFASAVVGSALALALLRRGWTLRMAPGTPVAFESGAHRIEPFAVCRRLASGDLAPDEWRRRCEEGGISALEIWKVAGASTNSPAP